MAVRVKLSAIKNILKKLDTCYVTVRVPRISLEIITKHYLDDIDENSIKKQTKLSIREFLGYEDPLAHTAKLKSTNQGFVRGYEYEEQPSLDYLDGKAIKKSAMRLREAYIPISFLLHIYNNGYTIKVPKLETLVLIIKKLEEVLEETSDILLRTNPDVLDFIEDFYNAIIDGRENKINALMDNERVLKLRENKSILGYMNKISDKTIDNKEIIKRKNGSIETLNLSDLIVK